ncbi:MAG: site-specific integrase [Chloroflexi bacterium]|nr:site-specific integrase [Chloroflexota bacterium]
MNTKIIPFFDTKAIDYSNLSDSTKIKYKKALGNYLATGNKITDPNSLNEYAQKLPTSSKSFLKAAIRLVTADYEQNLKSNATPENLPMVQAALLRLESLNSTIKVNASKGKKVHIWLSQTQVKELMHTCDDSLVGRRDWVVLALLVGAGLRREELTNIQCSDLIDLPAKNNKTRWVLQVNKGKGNKDRIIPISPILATRIKDWCLFISQGALARSLGQSKVLGSSLSAIGIFQIVRKHGAMIGLPEIDPHDLRRTYAQLGYEAGIQITQISTLLGHSDIATTQKYLNLTLDLENTVSDFIPLV